MSDTEDYMMISGIQHFNFCRRQWALIHIENIWEENALTVSGDLLHERAHNASLTEKRGDLIITRGMPVFSRSLKIYGVCDVVEFRRDESGVELFGREGLWLPCPVEYKNGRPKSIDADRLQLCAQAICLEEMLCCPEIETAYLYYGATKQRDTIALDSALREKVKEMFAEMLGYYERLYTPRVKTGKYCNSCSLRNVCLPELLAENQVAKYIKKALSDVSEK